MKTTEQVEKLKEWTTGGSEYRAEVTSTASPETIYEVLTELESHLKWTGEMLKGKERLLSIEHQEAPLIVGAEFDTTGSDNFGEWQDHSIVTQFQFPSVFEFVTDGRLTYRKPTKEPWRSTAVHHFEVTPTEHGSKISVSHRSGPCEQCSCNVAVEDLLLR